jgi:hypothetical protein
MVARAGEMAASAISVTVRTAKIRVIGFLAIITLSTSKTGHNAGIFASKGDGISSGAVKMRLSPGCHAHPCWVPL